MESCLLRCDIPHDIMCGLTPAGNVHVLVIKKVNVDRHLSLLGDCDSQLDSCGSGSSLTRYVSDTTLPREKGILNTIEKIPLSTITLPYMTNVSNRTHGKTHTHTHFKGSTTTMCQPNRMVHLHHKSTVLGSELNCHLCEQQHLVPTISY